MSLDSIVSVSISISSGGLTGPDYGTALALCNLSSAVETLWGPDLVRTYTSAAAMLAATEGFTSSDSGYKIANAYFSQNPKPAQIKIGRRQHKSTQIVKLTPTNTTPGFIYTGVTNGTSWTYTVLAEDDTAAKVATKLVTAIGSPTGVTPSDGTGFVLLTSTAGLVVEHSGFSTGLTVEDVTVAPDVAADLADIQVADDNWYFLLADAFGADELTDLATYTEATRKLCVVQTADSAVKTSATTDIAYVLKAASTFRTSLWYHKDMTFKVAPAMVGNRSTIVPGTDTWFGKTLVGPAPSDELTATEIGYIRAKNCNYLQTIGVSRTLGGWVSGGEYCDNVRGLDALRSDMQIAIASALFSASKIPNTESGRSIIKGAIETTLKNYTATDVQPQLLSPDVAQTIYMPPVTDATSFSAVTRTLSGITWSAGLANAIHAVTVTGTVTE